MPSNLIHVSRRLLIVGIMAGMLLLQHPSGDAGTATSADLLSDEESKDEAVAAAMARRAFGMNDRSVFATPSDLPTRAIAITPLEDNTPYLSRHIAGREIWHVQLDEVEIRLPSAPPGTEDLYERSFDVYVGPEGRLLKIESRWPQGVPPIPPEPDAESTTDQLWRSGEEVYHAFPDEPPPISFLEALDGLEGDIGNVLAAKQIKAQYVMWSKLDWKPKPMWVITLRGIPPYAASYPGVHVHLRDHLRFIVDPETGHWVQALSTPQPVLTKDERQAFAGGGIPADTVELYLYSQDDGQSVSAGDVITWEIEACVSDDVNTPYGLSMFSVDLVQDSATPNPNLIDIPRGELPDPLDRMGGFNRPAGISNPGPDGYGSGYGGTQIGPFGQKNLIQIGGGQNTFGVSGGSVGQDTTVETDIGKGQAVEILASGDFDAPCTPGDYTFTIENGVAYLLDVYNDTENYWEVKQATVTIPSGSWSVWKSSRTTVRERTPQINDVRIMLEPLIDQPEQSPQSTEP